MKRLASIAISLLILAVLWYHIDAKAIFRAMRQADPLWLGAGLACVVPLTLVTAWRFGLLSRTPLNLADTSRLILAASTLNLLLPSKMGDVAKAWVLRTRYHFDGRLALALVIFEKLIDLSALLFWGIIALLLVRRDISWTIAAAGLSLLLAFLLLLLSPTSGGTAALRRLARILPHPIGRQIDGFSDQWQSMADWFWHRPRNAALVWAVSLALWAGHLAQIWMFARALEAHVPLVGSMAAATLAILIGLLPFTLAGIGTRDAALISFYGAWLLPAQGAALGVLATMRYALPALAGLPFMHDYWDKKSATPPDQKVPRSPEHIWRQRLFAGVTASIVVYCLMAFFRPGTLQWDTYAIADDARQFLSWMPRLADPALLAGDLLADYWHSVSPPLYRLLFGIVASLGADPVMFGRFLAIPLLLTSTGIAWRIGLVMTQRPLPAFVTAAFVVGFLVHEDSIFTASPRAFGAPLVLLFTYGLLRQKVALLLSSLGLLAALYPQPAVVAFTMLALSRVRSLKPLRIDLTPRSLMLVGAAAALTAVAMLPFVLQTTAWGPTLTLSEARAMPNMMDPDARSAIVVEAGRIGWFCSYRMGYVPTLVPCGRGVAGAPLWNFLLYLPMLVLAAGVIFNRPDPASAHRNRIYLLALLAGTLWYVIAIAVAFRLHLPGRYSQRIQEVLEWLAIGQVLGLWIERLFRARPNAFGTRLAAFVLGGVIVSSFATPLPGIKRPSDYALIRYVSTLPKGSLIGGVSEDMNFIPALTGRAVLATPEHSIPYQLGYYRQIHNRLAATLQAISTPDPKVLRAYLNGYGVDYLLVERPTLATGVIPGRYPHILPAESANAAIALKERPSAVAAALPRCARYTGATLILLDGKCLARPPVVGLRPHDPAP